MRAFAHSIVETVRHPLLVLDDQLRVVDANAAFYHIFGGQPGGTIGHELFAIGGLWDHPRLRTLLREVILLDVAFKDVEIEYEVPGVGRRIMVLDGHRVLRHDDGMAMVLVAIEDDTERRVNLRERQQLNRDLEGRVAARTAELVRANRELEDANRELAAANRELEAFCFSVSHDLRSPLRAIDGFSQELLNRYAEKLDDQGQHYLRRVRTGTQRMGQLIDDLLKLSQVTRGEMSRVPVDLSDLAGVIMGELRERDPGRKVSFSAEPGLTASCDPRLIRVVLENLLGNAWKFTANKPAATIAFKRSELDGQPAFAVCDDGAGFDMAYAGKLFGAFQRLHSDREFPGTGIGLATVQRVIRRHGGEIRAEGALGRGAAFSFTLPGPEAAA